MHAKPTALRCLSWRPMVRAPLLSLLLALLPALPGPAFAAPPLPMRLPAEVRPLAVSLSLTVDPSQPSHQGEVEIDVELQRPLAQLQLHAKELRIRGAWLESGAHRLALRTAPLDAERIVLSLQRAPRLARQPTTLPAGRSRLVLAFDGRLQDTDVYGLFRQRLGLQAHSAWAAFTQFEPTGARLAFPLFDEPGFKLPWTLTLTVPAALTALSNMPVAQTDTADAPPGMKRVRFATTPPLPSYLLAFAVGDFESVDAGQVGATPLRVWLPRGRAADAAVAATSSARVLAALEQWFGQPHPFAKLDSLALPVTSGFDAMEHPGLVTYGSQLLLAAPGQASPQWQREHGSVVAHELAHQWFGNLVTPRWWDDLWLNESFASWLGDRITAELQPGWGWDLAMVRARERAMQADQLSSARRIQQPVERDEDFGNLWDAITYEKGQTVLAMAERWLGPERFRDGVRRLMQRHAWGSVRSDDFFAALAEVAASDAGTGTDTSADLPSALRSFTGQPGIPLLRVALHCQAGQAPRLALAQSRWRPLGAAAPAERGPGWQIPLLLRTPAGEQRLLLNSAEASLELADADCPAWVQANVGGVGYHRTAYAGDGLARLAAAPGLADAEALALLDDARALHAAGELDTAALQLQVQALAGHPRHALAELALQTLQRLDRLLPDDAAAHAAKAARWQQLFGDRARALGWLPADTDGNSNGDSDDQRLLRAQLLPAVADAGEDAGLRAQARRLAEAWLLDRASLPAALRPAVLRTAALDGDAGLFEALRAALRASDQRSERQDLLRALAHFRQPALAERARELLLDPALDIRDSLGPLLRSQANDAQLRHGALAFVERHKTALFKRLGRDDPAWLPQLFASACSNDEAKRLQAVFGPTARRYQGGELALARTLETVQQCVAWRQHHQVRPLN